MVRVCVIYVYIYMCVYVTVITRRDYIWMMDLSKDSQKFVINIAQVRGRLVVVRLILISSPGNGHGFAGGIVCYCARFAYLSISRL